MSESEKPSRKGKVGLLISGRGSNMVALVEAMRAGVIDADPAVVLSNVPGAPGLAKAESLGVPTVAIDSKQVKPRRVHEQRVIDVLREHDVDLVCLAGYMRLLSPLLVSEFSDRIVNIHPSLLPAFPGLDAQQQALDYGARLAGCTVHFVDEKCDHGPIILQEAVPIEDDDTDETLSARILDKEHQLYIRAVRLYFQNRLTLDGRRVRIASR